MKTRSSRKEWYAYEDADRYWSVYRNSRIISHNIQNEAAVKKLVLKRDGPDVKCVLELYGGGRRTITS